MSDTSSGQPPAQPDFLDRLIARHTAARPDAVRVRPRLPGPFERAEAVRSRTPETDTDPLTWPTVTPTAVPEREAPRPPAADVRRHTERERTVVRTERAQTEPPPRPAPPPQAAPPLLRPVAPLAPGPRPAPRTGSRTAGQGRSGPDADRTAAAVPIPPGTAAAPPTVASAALPSAADTAAAREAVRQTAARRPARTPEQVVQVQIGRLEVTAGQGPSRNGTRPPTRTDERPEAALSLADYLARGRE